jgi:PGF-pre-PGF domain-containing protein
MDGKKKPVGLRHKLFWLILAVVIVLPLTGMLTGMFTLELATSGKAIQTISHKTTGSELFFEVRNIDGLKVLTLNFLEDTKNMIIEFEEVDTLGWKFEGTVYSQFKVSSEDSEKVGEIKFSLKLEEEKLNRLGLSKDEVKLYFSGQELETELIKSDKGYVYYEAVSSGMGEFVIGKAKPKVEEEPIEEVEVPEEEKEPEAAEEQVIEPPAPVKEGLLTKISRFFKNLFN